MGLRINNNIQAVNGHRNLQKNDAMAGRSMEKLSSGLRINKAADDAAGLIISEQMRAQIAGLGQAISNSETAVNLVQTAEGALDEMNTLLKKARTLALHAANEGANDSSQLVADQSELDNITSSITRIAEQTQFGNKKLLDGSLTAFRSNSDLVGTTKTGNHYAEGLKTGTITRGYHSLIVTANASQSNLVVTMAGASDIIASASTSLTSGTWATCGNATNSLSGMQGLDQFQKGFTLAVNGKTLNVTSGSTKNDLLSSLNAIGRDLGFKAILVENAGASSTSGLIYQAPVSSGGLEQATQNLGMGNIALISDKYGSAATLSLDYVAGASGATVFDGGLTAGNDMAGFLVLNSGAVGTVAQPLMTTGGGTAVSNTGSWIALAQSGSDLSLVSTTPGQGYRINLNAMLVTNYVSGMVGGGALSGLPLGSGFSGIEGYGIDSGTLYAGVIDGMSAGSTFQVGANVGQTVTVEMASMKAGDLGTGASGQIKNLDALAGSLVGGNAQEALKVIDKAIEEVTSQRGRLGAFQANTLESGLNSLRVSKENLTGAESNIRDVDFADESSQFTKYQILVQASTAMLAQANQLPQNVLKLLG